MRLYNLREVHRPTNLEDAIRFLRRKDVNTIPLGGGVALVGEGGPEIEAVVDLSLLGLETIEREDGVVRLGAMVRLQTLTDDLGDVASGFLAQAAQRTATRLTRNSATLGGMLMSAAGANPLLVTFGVLDVEIIVVAPKERTLPFATFLSERKQLRAKKALLTVVIIREAGGSQGYGYADIGRSPAGAPILCAACRIGPDGEARFAVGGVWEPIIICQTGSDPARAVTALTDAAGQAPLTNDYLATAGYRAAMLPVLVGRAMAQARTQQAEGQAGGSR